MKCEICGKITDAIEHHHVKYLDIHGVDETKILCISCHRSLHIRLRREGKCNIPSNELLKISNRSSGRSIYGKQHRNEYLHKHVKNYDMFDRYEDLLSIRTRIRHNSQSGFIGVYTGFIKRACVK